MSQALHVPACCIDNYLTGKKTERGRIFQQINMWLSNDEYVEIFGK